MGNFYDRTRNITGVSTDFAISPQYGSSASFKVKSSNVLFGDKLLSVSHNGLNFIDAQFSFNLSLRESDAQKLVNFYENQTGTGVFGVSDSSEIYRNLSGTIDSLSRLESSNNGLYDVSLAFNVERNAPSFSWSGMSFVNNNLRKWASGESFQKYDICWVGHDYDKPHLNWFYCLDDHQAVLDNHPLSTGSFWTQNLFSNSNERFSLSQTPYVKKTELKNSYTERVNDQKNIHSFESFDVSWSNINDKHSKALIHFAESKAGTSRFNYQLPEIYNQPKTFICPSWNHQWVAKDSNNISFSLVEDPLGIVEEGKPSFFIIQNSGAQNLTLGLTGDGVFFKTGDRKEIVSGNSLRLNWPSTGSIHFVKLYGNIFGITGSGQSINSIIPWNSPSLECVNFSGNNLKSLNLHLCPNLKSIDLNSNSIDGFDLYGMKSLEVAKLANNSGSYLSIENCLSLTGLYAKLNSFDSLYIDKALENIDSYGLSNGYVDFSGMSSNSGTFVNPLLGKGWSLNVSYFSPSTTTTTTSTTTPSIEPSYPLTAAVANDSYSACLLPGYVDVSGNGNTWADSTKISYPEGIFSDSNVKFFSNGTSYYAYTQICCGKASFIGGGLCSLATTTEAPTTTSSTTTEEPSTTTSTTSTTPPIEIYGCTDFWANNYNPSATIDDGSCTYDP